MTIWLLIFAAAMASAFQKAEAEPLSATSGLTYHLYENAALAGTPGVTGTTASAELSLSAPKTNNGYNENTCYLSGELVGTATIATDGRYTFDCHFEGTSTGWVWIDGHLVCGDGHAYLPRDEIDNPLPIRTARKQEYPFRAHITRNDTDACRTGAVAAPSVKIYWKREALPDAKEKLSTNDNFQLMTQEPILEANTGRLMDSDVTFQPQLSPSEEKREELQRSPKPCCC